MRKNLPVTANEKTFSNSTKLISVTDLNSNIVDCNDAFVEVSGFEKHELIGQPHNIVRHPDMPAEAFKVMWEHLKSGKPWMGLVKNRCKNGDYYWVDAYVTPVTENGKVIGYESVRSCPKRRDVERATQLYQRINSGNARIFSLPLSIENLLLIASIIICTIIFSLGHKDLAEGLLLVAVISYAGFVSWSRKQTMEGLNALLSHAFSHELAVKSYTDDSGELGKLKVSILSQLAHLGTVITRIEISKKNGQSNYLVLFIDVDDFKGINDKFGHCAGDSYLKETAMTLTNSVSNGSIIARLGGDEFFVVINLGSPKVNSELKAYDIIKNILHVLSLPVLVEGRKLKRTVSIGAATNIEKKCCLEVLQFEASKALTHARLKGRNNYSFFDEALNDKLIRKNAILELLASDSILDEWCVNYQAISDTDGVFVGYEALIRWYSP